LRYHVWRYLEVLEGLLYPLDVDGPESASLQCMRHLPNVARVQDAAAKSGSAVRSRTERSGRVGRPPTCDEAPVTTARSRLTRIFFENLARQSMQRTGRVFALAAQRPLVSYIAGVCGKRSKRGRSCPIAPPAALSHHAEGASLGACVAELRGLRGVRVFRMKDGARFLAQRRDQQ
jgi:hypothetical protein